MKFEVGAEVSPLFRVKRPNTSSYYFRRDQSEVKLMTESIGWV
jgi:hypothetical protein